MRVRFGTAGNSESYLKKVSKSSMDAPKWLSEIGLDAYEYQCGRGVNVGAETARKFGEKASEYGIALSLHAPYFINLANPNPENFKNNARYILQSCEAASYMGADRVIVHSGSVMKFERAEALGIAKDALGRIIALCDEAGFGHIALCPETMGKINQLGDLDETLELCSIDDRLLPCVDFGHLYARNLGALTSPEDFEAIFDTLEDRLGFERVKNFHIHFSRIEYTPRGGELRHLTFDDKVFGPDFEPAARIIARRGYGPTVICESAGTQAEDALIMKKILERVIEEEAG